MELIQLLERLCAPVAPPGREEQARLAVSELVEPLAHRVETDRLGNLKVWLNPEQRPLVMLDAHLDEVGLVVQHIDDKGFIKVAPLGGLDQRLLPGSRVLLETAPGSHLTALAGLRPPHVEKPGERDKALTWEQIYLDTGLHSAEAVEKAGIAVGSMGVIDAGMGPIGDGCFYARNLDNRAGCAAAVTVLARLAGRADELGFGLVVNFAVSEEVGLRGAATAAFDLAPDLALVLETTVGETPGLEPARQPSQMGKGPAITVADGRIVVPRAMVDSLEAAAKHAGVACQRKKPPYGGTDAGAIHISRGGVVTGVVSVPTRYIHSPVSMLKLSDLEAMTELALAWLPTCGDLL